ncbi:hypothetical protein [Roseicyclus persicicus]|uniref:Uncharacterized protein n=1 Tax=Roseicyclus persicicus TaxID=2650661 RepID=A0A7X6GY21_9RHOB|nr:hypothetical protein [Roseibacterium persicicum]NKX43391.1 hypothetical protein [Roseibacterium persicicum]
MADTEMPSRPPRHLGATGDFLRRESGAAKTRTGFFLAAGLGVLVVLVFLMLGGGQQGPEDVRPTPEQAALAELMEGGIRQFNATQVQVRLERYLNPAERTDAQLRNAHRTWARRAGDRSYGEPDLAHDMFAIIDAALRLRGVQPHDDI